MLRVASYNVHQFVGADGRRDPGRIASIIRELTAEVVGLQEVTSSTTPGHELDQVRLLSEQTGLEAIVGTTLIRRDGHYGNALLTSGRIVGYQLHDLSVPGREPRGAIEADVDFDGRGLRVIVTHLGLRAAERRRQAEKLLELADEGKPRVLVLMGDFNEWQPFGRATRLLQRCLGRAHSAPTFPAKRPWLRLDRIWVKPAAALVEVRVHDTPQSRVASDHLPLRARLNLDAATEPS